MGKCLRLLPASESGSYSPCSRSLNTTDFKYPMPSLSSYNILSKSAPITFTHLKVSFKNPLYGQSHQPAPLQLVIFTCLVADSFPYLRITIVLCIILSKLHSLMFAFAFQLSILGAHGRV